MKVVQLPPEHARHCEQCGAVFAPAMLACPECGRLVHAAELSGLAAVATDAEAAGRLTDALAAWRQVLDLLPPDTRQAETVRAQIGALGKRLGKPSAAKRGWAKGVAGLGVLGAILSKLKFLLLGLTKAGTLLTMLATISLRGSYAWQLAVGVVLCIYVHEMGHVATLQRYGFKATAPMFIPGLGALVLLRQHPVNPHEDARIGLAGPLWGLGTVVVAFAVFLVTHATIWGAIAKASALLNLFNLAPVWQLDGGRAFRALTRRDRWLAVVVIAIMWFTTGSGWLLLVLLALAAYTAAFGRAPEDEDRPMTLLFTALVVAFSLFGRIPVAFTGVAGP